MNTSSGILNISGGYIFVRAEGDGVDSNGNLNISGGTTIICGPTGGGNGIFDIGDNGSSFNHTGGVFFGIGSSDMAVYPSSKTYITGQRRYFCRKFNKRCGLVGKYYRSFESARRYEFKRNGYLWINGY